MKLIISSLVWCGLVFGQQTNTIFKTLTTTKVGSEAISSTIPSIGQGYHQFTVNESGASCSGTYFWSVMEGSFDNSTWSQIPTTLTFNGGVLVNSSSRNYAATGLYPYMRVHIYPYDVVNCSFSVSYAGSLYPPNNSSTVFFPKTQRWTTIVNASGNLWTTTAYMAQYTVYGVTACNLSSTANSIQFDDNVSYVYFAISVPAFGCSVVPVTPTQLFYVPNSATLLHVTLSSAVSTSLTIWYRQE